MLARKPQVDRFCRLAALAAALLSFGTAALAQPTPPSPARSLAPSNPAAPPATPAAPNPLQGPPNVDLGLNTGAGSQASEALLTAGLGFGIASTPNMFGDLFNSGSTTTMTFQGPTVTERFAGSVPLGTVTLFNDQNGNGAFDVGDVNMDGIIDLLDREALPVTAPNIANDADMVRISLEGAVPTMGAVAVSQEDSLTVTNNFLGDPQADPPIPQQTTFALEPENTAIVDDAVNRAEAALQPGATVSTGPPLQVVAENGPALDASTVAVTNLQAEIITSSGDPISADPPAPAPGSIDANGASVIITYDLSAQPLVETQGEPIIVTTIVPGGAPGATVGRQKITENSSPIPRTRFISNLSYFNDTPLTAAGQDVTRVVFGFEKAFANNMLSVEFRAPFASTLDSNAFVDDAGGVFGGVGSEFGNAVLYFKSLLATADRFALGAGVGVTLPTANDYTLSDAAGTPLLVVENEALHLLPYVGFVYSPSDRVFMQGFLQFDLDTGGNPTFVADPATGSLTPLGRLRDTDFVFADVSFGYWLYRRPARCRRCGGRVRGLTGLAPVLELHYNGDTDLAAPLSTGVVSSTTPDSFDLLNITVGAHMRIGSDKTLDLAFATPIAGNDDQFDGELRLSFNWFRGGAPRTPGF